MADVVFVVSEQVRREEFQYALRSLDNIPHDTVWLVGGKPEWVRNVEHVPFPDEQPKWKNISDKFQSLAKLEGLSEEFIYTEDDYFILRPFDRLPRYVHPDRLAVRVAEFNDKRGKLAGWSGYLLATLRLLRAHGFDDPWSFDVHVPMYVNKATIPDWPTEHPVSYRSICGNLDPRDPIPMKVDPKAKQSLQWRKVKEADEGFLSSADVFFRRIGMEKYMESLFPEPCRYEQEGA